MIKTIALISPFDGFQSYGIRVISSFLQANGIETRLICLPSYTSIASYLIGGESYEAFPKTVVDQVRDVCRDCDAIGITMMTIDKERVESLVSGLKDLNKPIVLGGIHPTAFPEDAIKLADIINVGEGLNDFVAWCKEPSRRDIKGMWFREPDGSVIKNNVGPAMDNVDNWPFPDWYTEGKHFILYKGQIKPMTQQLLNKFMGNYYHFFASVGCPFKCTFCINSRFLELGQGYQKFRYHSIDYMIEEIRWGLSLTPNTQFVNIADDGFIFLKEEIMAEFCRRYKEEIGVPFAVLGVIPNYVSEEKIAMLVDAGMIRSRLGFQSGNKESLKKYKRPGKVEQYHEAHAVLQKFEPQTVFPYYDIIMDNPLVDMEQDMVDSIEFLLSLDGRFTLFLYSMRMYPGTPDFKEAQELGISEEYFTDSYLDRGSKLLNYTLTFFQIGAPKWIIRKLLNRYHQKGNHPVPKLLFKINKAIFLARIAVEHLRKGDTSAMPPALARMMKGRRKKPIHKFNPADTTFPQGLSFCTEETFRIPQPEPAKPEIIQAAS